MSFIASIRGLLRWAWVLIVALLWFHNGHARSFDQEEVAHRADAIVAVEVVFVPYGDMVLVGEVLRGEPLRMSSANDLLGDCLPGKARVRELALRHENTAQGAVFSEAIARATYGMVAFVKSEGGENQVICGDEYSTANWESDPRFAVWRKQLETWLEKQ